MAPGELKQAASLRLEEFEDIPEYKELNKKYVEFCRSVGDHDIKEKVEELEKFTDNFFCKSNITDRVMQNKIAFKAFCIACRTKNDPNPTNL